jgi:hypothetical protein
MVTERQIAAAAKEQTNTFGRVFRANTFRGDATGLA